MNTKRFVFASIAIFIAVFIFEFVVHGVLLKGTYDATQELWRPQAESPMHFMFIGQFAFALVTAFFFTRNHEGKGLGEGIRFGVILGALLASLEISKYCYMPIPFSLMMYWFASSFVKGILAGAVASLVYKKD